MSKIVTTHELGDILGITDRWIQKLVKEGTIKQESRGKFDLSTVIRQYISHAIEVEKGKRRSSDDIELDEAIRRKEAAIAQIKELELEKRKAEIYEKSEIIEAWQKLLSILKTRLLNLGSKTAPQLIGLSQINEIKIKIDTEIKNILDELSKSNIE